MDTIRKLDFDGRKIWIRKFGEGKVLLTTSDNNTKHLLCLIMERTQDNSIEPLVSFNALCPNDLQGATSFIIDSNNVNVIFDLKLLTLGFTIKEKDGEQNE